MIFQTVKPTWGDARRKEIALLLAADDVDDESQMDVALHGELAGKIVEQIFEQASKGTVEALPSNTCFVDTTRDTSQRRSLNLYM